MDAATAHAVLSRAGRRGNAAIAILSVGEKHMVMQRKTEGYPYHTMVGGLCLFGGNKEEGDESARETLIRELREELPLAWSEAIEKTLSPFSR
jgi:8-oxo-dGTP pyrophosphatase MutT (NUDIX family)